MVLTPAAQSMWHVCPASLPTEGRSCLRVTGPLCFVVRSTAGRSLGNLSSPVPISNTVPARWQLTALLPSYPSSPMIKRRGTRLQREKITDRRPLCACEHPESRALVPTVSFDEQHPLQKSAQVRFLPS
ncbi:hypothetical protein NDU88_001839 [Pleurodeles waltl]|uniref:Uncharacterized protein n=1 Tax=Pleurodeles waltl TaxID=8319 RepID=A0AAV7TJY9_PLEWA|nr:hypothetical protein NDU88_001839 [Pleurodeles waltl]